MVTNRSPSATTPLTLQQVSDLAYRLPDPVLLVDPQLRTLWANESAERLFGIAFADSAGLSGHDFVHPDDLGATVLALETVRSKRVGTPLEVRVLAHDGWRLVELIGAPSGDNTLVSVRDVTQRRRWEIAHDTDARFRSLVHNSPVLTMLIDAVGRVQSSSAAFPRLLGHDQQSLEGRLLEQVVEPSDAERWREALSLACDDDVESGSSVTVDLLLTHRDGSPVPFALTVKNLLDDPTVNGLVVSGHDITDRLAVEESLRSANSVLEATLESTADGILVADAHGRISSFNRRFTELWNVPADVVSTPDDETLMKHVLAQLADPAEFMAQIAGVNAAPDASSRDLLELRDGRLFEQNSLPQRIDGEVVGRVWSHRDVTQDRQLRDELTQQAFHDALTGLPNQSLFRERVERAMERIELSNGSLAVLFIDLDDFKTVNDSLGHPVGDELLVAMSNRLLTCLRTRDTAARLGGDEFAVLIEDLDDEAHARSVADRIVDVLREPVTLRSRRVVVGASVGIAYGRPGAGIDGSTLLRNADLAMYTAKGQGKSCFREYVSEMHHAAVERLELEGDLRGAPERGEFAVHYQPIYQTGSEQVIAVEALARWQHPERGLLEPGSFIPLAEATGLIDEIGDHVLDAALRQAWRWEAALGQQTPAVTVNLSPHQLRDRSLPERLMAQLVRSSVRPELLILEITENALMADPDTAAVNLRRLHDAGVRLAVDDFGTGYSSLSYLQQFPIDYLKIDGSFVDDMLVNSESSMVEAIVQLSKTLGLIPIAEGVETQAQAAALLSIGCDLTQGFFRARPLDADAVHELLVGSVASTHLS